MSSRLNFVKDWAALAKDAGYSASTLAHLTRVSPRQLERFFKEHKGRVPHRWLRDERMRHAVELICEGRTMKEVAAELGYKDTAHFTRDFKHYFGITPSHYPADACPPRPVTKMPHNHK